MEQTDKSIEEIIEIEEPKIENTDAPAEEKPINDDGEDKPDKSPEKPQVKMVAEEEVNRLVAEAEARGYLRGRNEVVAASVHTPQLWENPRRTDMEREEAPDPADGFLSKIRPGVWD